MSTSHVVARHRRARRGELALLLGALTAGLADPSVALAHMGSRKHLDVVVVDGGADVTVAVDAIDASIALGRGVDVPDPAALLPDAPLLASWLVGGLAVSDAGVRCAAVPRGARVVERGGTPFVAVALAFRCPPRTTSAVGLALRDDTVFDVDPDHRTLVTIRGRDGGVRTDVLSSDRRELALETEPSTLDAVATFVYEGARHLAIGLDHLAFLLVLLFAAGPVAARRGLRPTLREVAWVVTAFTAGHSVSLGASALGFVTLPGRLVETTIAISIVAVAALNFFRPDARHDRAWLALAFGVVHGFGFSSVLSDVGLPAQSRLVALASFNVGIELAQLAFVATVLVPLAWMAARPHYRRVVMQGASAVIALVACYWVVERAAGF